jgi:hypothetical protein
VQRLVAQLAEHGLHDRGVPVSEHVDAKTAQAVDELAAADVLEGRATIAPLDGRVVGRDRLAVVKYPRVDVTREVRDAVSNDLVLLLNAELVLLHELKRFARLVQDTLAQQLVHVPPSFALDRGQRARPAQRRRVTEGCSSSGSGRDELGSAVAGRSQSDAPIEGWECSYDYSSPPLGERKY